MRDAQPLARIAGARALLRFALPSMVSMLFMGLYTLADTLFVSRLAGTLALSALNIVCPVINLTVGLGSMLASGGSAIVSAELGAGQADLAARDFSLIVLAGALLGFLIGACGTCALDPLIRLLGASDAQMSDCRAYLGTLLFFTPASMLQVLFQNLLVTAGRPGLGMALAVCVGLSNALLDWVFMGPLDMGILGSALGTGIGYVIPSLGGLLFFARRRGGLRLCRPAFRARMLLRACANGASELISQAASAVTTFLFNLSMMRLLGEDGVAAITILIYAQFLLTSLFIGFSMGVAPVLSFQAGRGDRAKMRSLLRVGLRLIAGSSVAVFAAALRFDAPLTSLFAPEGTPVYAIAREGLRILPFGFLFCGVNIFASASLTALGDGRRSALLSSLRTFVLTSLLLLTLPRLFGVTGVFLAVPIAEAATCSLAAIVWPGSPALRAKKAGDAPRADRPVV